MKTLEKKVHFTAEGTSIGCYDSGGYGNAFYCYLKSEADKIIGRQKYKRCMAMAKYCEYRFMNLEKMIDTEYRTKKMRFSHRWWVKWLKLADNFKENIK